MSDGVFRHKGLSLPHARGGNLLRSGQKLTLNGVCLSLLSYLSIFVGSLTSAQTRVTLEPQVDPTINRAKLPELSATPEPTSDLRFYFGLENSSYVRANQPYFRKTAEAQQSLLQLGLSADRPLNGWGGRVDVRDDFRPGENFHYLKPKELFVSFDLGIASASLGRKLARWSETDELWRQGLWQPRFNDDKILRERAGLFGLFLERERGGQNLTLLASPMFIPELGVDVNAENNQFTSKNPWFRPPPTQAFVNNLPTEVRYTLVDPDIAKIARQSTFAGKYEVHDESGAFLRISGARKPMNQLFLGAPVNVFVATPNYATVDVNARVLRHDIWSAEAGWAVVGGWHLWGGLMREKVIRDQTPENWTTQEATDADVFSAYLGRDLDSVGRNHIFAAWFSVQGGNAPDQGDVTASTPFFEGRYIYNRAYMTGFRHSGHWFSRRQNTNLETRLIFDEVQSGVLASLIFAQELPQGWRVSATADFLGLTDESRIVDGFFADYRANDRVSLGVQYGF